MSTKHRFTIEAEIVADPFALRTEIVKALRAIADTIDEADAFRHPEEDNEGWCACSEYGDMTWDYFASWLSDSQAYAAGRQLIDCAGGQDDE